MRHNHKRWNRPCPWTRFPAVTTHGSTSSAWLDIGYADSNGFSNRDVCGDDATSPALAARATHWLLGLAWRRWLW